jgi:hypothetical protein
MGNDAQHGDRVTQIAKRLRTPQNEDACARLLFGWKLEWKNEYSHALLERDESLQRPKHLGRWAVFDANGSPVENSGTV